MLFDNRQIRTRWTTWWSSQSATALWARWMPGFSANSTRKGDAFLPGMEYIRQWGYQVDEHETVIIPPSILR